MYEEGAGSFQWGCVIIGERVCRRLLSLSMLLLVSFCVYPFVCVWLPNKIRGRGQANINKCHDVWHLQRGLNPARSLFFLFLLLLLAFKRLMMPTRTQATQALSSTGSDRRRCRRRRRRLSIIFACNFHNIFVLDHLHRDTKTRLPFCERECVQLCLLSNKSFTDLYSVHTTHVHTYVCV